MLGLATLASGQGIEALEPGQRIPIDSEPWNPSQLIDAKVIYGADDRIDVFEETDPLRLKLSQSVCGLIRIGDVTDIGGGVFSITTKVYSIGGRPPCEGEPFASQPTAAFCTGFLVGGDVIVTAGHCYDEGQLDRTLFVFGFVMEDAETAVTTVHGDQIYQGVEVVSQVLTNSLDYAVIRVDRPVTSPGAEPLQMRRSGVVPLGTPLGVIGHPSGLPLKIAFGSDTQVMGNEEADFIVANLDTYGGNSGSPVFNAVTGVVEGILVRGETDFVRLDTCFVSNELPDSEGQEESTKTTSIEKFVPLFAATLNLDKSVYACGDTLTASIRDENAFAPLAVMVSTPGGDAETITLTQATETVGIFVGTMSLEEGAVVSGNGVLEVADGTMLTFVHEDADNGAGEMAMVIAEVGVDCTAPSASDVLAGQIGESEATVTFTTDEEVVAVLSFGTECGMLADTAPGDGLSTTHEIMLTALDPATEYFFAVALTDVAGNTAVDDGDGTCFSFATAEPAEGEGEGEGASGGEGEGEGGQSNSLDCASPTGPGSEPFPLSSGFTGDILLLAAIALQLARSRRNRFPRRKISGTQRGC